MSIWSIFWGDQFHHVDLVYSGLIQFPYGFWVFRDWIGLDQLGVFQPLVCTIHSGLLIRMRVVLQGVSGGALGVVR